MEPVLETVDADVETATELLFRVTVEGLDQAPTKVRLVCEDGDTGYVFNGRSTDQAGVLAFVIPPNRLKETTYLSRVEVLVEGRYFTPVSFNLLAKKAVKVVVEAVRPVVKTPEVKVTAEPIVVKKLAVVEAVKEEALKVTPVKATVTAPTLKERRMARMKKTDLEALLRSLANETISLKQVKK